MTSSNDTEIEKTGAGLTGLTVAAFESRMAEEMSDLITRHGGIPRVAPSMREIPLTDNKEAFEFFERLKEKPLDLIVFMTGTGTRTLFQALLAKYPKSLVEKAFKRVTLAARGPKSVKALKEFGFRASLVAEEPNTWREMLEALGQIKNKKIAIQEYGAPNPDFYQALRRKGALEIIPFPVYRWALPENTGPLRDLITDITEGRIQVSLFTSAQQAHHTIQLAEDMGLGNRLKTAFSMMSVGSVGSVTSEALRSLGIGVDFEPEHPKMGFLVQAAAEKSVSLIPTKLMRGSTLPSRRADELKESLFLKACRKEPTARTPFWIMRQAGRYLPEYQEIRSKVSFLELCKTPELACEATVSAQEVLGADAAILFADILLIAEPMGFNLEFVEKGGPKIDNPFRQSEDLERMEEVDASRDLSYVLEAVRQIRSRLQPDIPLIGFAGAPFTLASYLMEGGSSRDFKHTRSLLAEDPACWEKLMEKIVPATATYLNAQVEAGAQALQLFDSWVGILTPPEYKRFVLPHVRRLIAALKPGIPVIYFGVHTGPFFPFLKETGATVIGVDWNHHLDEAWKLIGDVAIQGNLDPKLLLEGSLNDIRVQTEDILRRAKGRPGHIFNLGHGILPQTPMENVRTMIETVKKWKNK
jgi:uroporphyrinogen decarboxylase